MESDLIIFLTEEPLIFVSIFLCAKRNAPYIEQKGNPPRTRRKALYIEWNYGKSF